MWRYGLQPLVSSVLQEEEGEACDDGNRVHETILSPPVRRFVARPVSGSWDPESLW